MVNEVNLNREMGVCFGKLFVVCNYMRFFICWDNDIYREDIKLLIFEIFKFIVNFKI